MSKNILSTTLNKIDAFFKNKRVMVTKPYEKLTDQEKKKLKPKQYTDKKGHIKTFVRVQATGIEDF